MLKVDRNSFLNEWGIVCSVILIRYIYTYIYRFVLLSGQRERCYCDLYKVAIFSHIIA
jgi:hypothetical protein